MENKKYLYKYRSLKNFARFVDIILNNRLHGSTYTQLDDAMEGRFKRPVGIDKELLDKIYSEKGSYYICSLSKTATSSPMWALYADEHKGCCIELEVTSKLWEKEDVKYSERMPTVFDDVKVIITTKSKEWQHQQEVRYLKKIIPGSNKSKTLSIKINRIIFGLRVSTNDFNLYKKLINTINPNIEVTRLKWKNSALGYEDDAN